MSSYFRHQFAMVFHKMTIVGLYDQCRLKADIFQLIEAKRTFCASSVNIKDEFFLTTVVNALISIAKEFVEENKQRLATFAIYCSFEVLLEFSTELTYICTQSLEIHELFSLLLIIDLASHVYMVYLILETYSKFFGLYIDGNLKCKFYFVMQGWSNTWVRK